MEVSDPSVSSLNALAVLAPTGSSFGSGTMIVAWDAISFPLGSTTLIGLCWTSMEPLGRLEGE